MPQQFKCIIGTYSSHIWRINRGGEEGERKKSKKRTFSLESRLAVALPVLGREIVAVVSVKVRLKLVFSPSAFTV